jgi:hypothetical protein
MLDWAGVRGIYATEDKCMQDFSGKTKWKVTNLKYRGTQENNIKRNLNNLDKSAWTVVIWLRIKFSISVFSKELNNLLV